MQFVIFRSITPEVCLKGHRLQLITFVYSDVWASENVSLSNCVCGGFTCSVFLNEK